MVAALLGLDRALPAPRAERLEPRRACLRGIANQSRHASVLHWARNRAALRPVPGPSGKSSCPRMSERETSTIGESVQETRHERLCVFVASWGLEASWPRGASSSEGADIEGELSDLVADHDAWALRLSDPPHCWADVVDVPFRFLLEDESVSKADAV
jgi:hypothetical protein